MGNCKFCGKPAGFLRSKHSVCAEYHERALSGMREAVSNAVQGALPISELNPKLIEIAREGFVTEAGLRAIVIEGWESAVNHFLEDGVLDETEEGKLFVLKEQFNLSQDELDKNGAYMQVSKAGLLREILESKLPTRVNIQGNLPFNFQKNETMIWAFNDVAYLEDKTRTQYVGRSSGVSIRVCKGVYYRVGAFQGNPVSYTERVHLDTGPVVITNKHTYFGGSRKALRIAHAEVVSFAPYSDGIGITRDTASAKQQIFVTGDGWFTYNLLTNLSQL